MMVHAILRTVVHVAVVWWSKSTCTNLFVMGVIATVIRWYQRGSG